MGIIRVGIDTIKGTLADQYLESIIPDNMDARTIMTTGKAQEASKQSKHASSNVITDGSLIQVGENQTMLLVDGGKIIDYTAEAGYFEVSNDEAPSMLNGQFGETLNDAFKRFRFGGGSPHNQQVYYINTQEIRDIPFGTQNPINYFDSFYNAELYLRAHGYYSIRVTNPLKFYSEMAPRNSGRVTIDDMQRIALSEFLTAFQAALGKMSVDGERISFISSKTMELAEYMRNVLDKDWEERRGFKIESVGISSISYDDATKKLISMRSEGAMLADQSVREGYVAGSVARGMESAGSNPGGSGMGVIGMGMMGRASEEIFPKQPAQQQAQQQAQQPAQQQAQQQTQTAAPAQNQGATWTCTYCGNTAATGQFCSNCGKERAATNCSNCNAALAPGAKFCNQCGQSV